MGGVMTAIDPVRLILVALIGFGLSAGGTRLLIELLNRRQILDQPNERSSHTVPTPRGGGIAVLGSILIAWIAGLALSPDVAMFDLIILGAAAALGLVCFIDDLRGLQALPRLLAQAAAVAPGLWLLSDLGGLFRTFLPPALDLAATGFLWLWFINLFNFMDGIDGITGVQIVAIGIGLAGLVTTGAIAPSLLDPAIALTAGGLGFLVWNWRPARIFMGDVGSIPIGYLIGWLLINGSHGTAEQGTALAACLILPAYYLSDASFTLVRRLISGENVLRAHRQHFYQKAVIRGVGHGVVCGWVMLADGTLIIIAWFLAASHPLWAIASAGCIIMILLLQMRGFRPNSTGQEDVE
jgi:UDP-N-acetylmuramyl pentapeptide phosphotransferase/UDP-N-acetylglucosamine-1-phosphate transferase